MCSIAASTAQQDPIGSGYTLDRLLVIETPTPWGDDMYKRDANGTIRQRMRDVQMTYLESVRAAGLQESLFRHGYPSTVGVRPDAEWSRPDRCRVIIATRPTGLLAEYEMAEYSFRAESEQLVELAHAFYADPSKLAAFESQRVDRPHVREFFVCTHGQVDLCCAKFGIPLYNQARAAYPRVRAWRTTHFGGHRFAPTVWDFPSGIKWGFVDPRRPRARSSTRKAMLSPC
jgi:hypothetical protein